MQPAVLKKWISGPRAQQRFPSVVLVMLFVGAVLPGCALNQPERAVLTESQISHLLSGRGVFGDEVLPDRPTHNDFLAPTAAMQEFVSLGLADGPKKPHASRIASILLDRLAERGYFDNTYRAEETYSASDTFQHKRGNCLSFTNLFIALAREAGLKAEFQLVDVPPSWQAESTFVLRSLHINAVVSGLAKRPRSRSAFTVDFNHVQTDPEYEHRVISDDEARSLLQSNLGVVQLLQNQPKQGFVYLSDSIKTAPHNSDHWVNLAAFYSTSNATDEAIHAYHRALELNPNSRSALAGLGRVYTRLGRPRIGKRYHRLARRYLERNPQFHYSRARALYERGEFESALTSANRAVALKKSSVKFHLLLAKVQYELNDIGAAKMSVARADKLQKQKKLGEDNQVPNRIVRTYQPSTGPNAERPGTQRIQLNR